MESRTVVNWYWTAAIPRRPRDVGDPFISAATVTGLLRQSAIDVVSELGFPPEVPFRFGARRPAVERLFDEFARFGLVFLRDDIYSEIHRCCAIEQATGAALPGSLRSFNAVTRVRFVGESKLVVPAMLVEGAVSLLLESLVTARPLGPKWSQGYGELQLDGVSRDGQPADWKRGRALASCFAPAPHDISSRTSHGKRDDT